MLMAILHLSNLLRLSGNGLGYVKPETRNHALLVSLSLSLFLSNVGVASKGHRIEYVFGGESAVG